VGFADLKQLAVAICADKKHPQPPIKFRVESSTLVYDIPSIIHLGTDPETRLLAHLVLIEQLRGHPPEKVKKAVLDKVDKKVAGEAEAIVQKALDAGFTTKLTGEELTKATKRLDADFDKLIGDSIEELAKSQGMKARQSANEVLRRSA
jgi:hypothetical protein